MATELAPGDEDIAKITAGFDRLIQGGATTTANIQRYLDPNKAYAAELFDLMAPTDPNAVEPADLLAVTLLDLETPVGMVRDLLSPQHGGLGKLDDVLLDIPNDVDLWDATDEHLTTTDTAWSIVKGIHDVGWVRAGKLLARKRPRLIPIWDRVVRDFFEAPDAVWAGFRHCLADPQRREAITALAPPNWPNQMSLLRLIDIGAWMYYR